MLLATTLIVLVVLALAVSLSYLIDKSAARRDR